MKVFQNIFIFLSSVATVLTVCQTANAGNAGLNVGNGRIRTGLERQYLEYQLQNNGNSLRWIRVIPDYCIIEFPIFSPPHSPTLGNDPWYGREEINILPTVEEGEILFGSVLDTSTVLLGGEDFTGVGEILGEETLIVQGGYFPTATLFLPLLALLFFLGGDSGSSDTVMGNIIVTGDTGFTSSSTNESNSTGNEQNTIVDVDEPSVTNAIVLLTLILCLLRYRQRYSKEQVIGKRCEQVRCLRLGRGLGAGE